MIETNLRRATTFHAVATAGGISAAARALNKSASAVHYDISAFQREIGCALFERVGRRLQLTPQGRLLFETVSRALDEIGRARARIAADGLAAAPLRVACVSGFGRYRLAPRLLAWAEKARPVELVFGAHDAVVAAVAERRADYGISYKEVVATPIRSERAADEEIVLIAPAETDTSQPLPDFKTAPFISYDEYEYVFARWFDACRRRQPESLRIVDHMSEMEEALESCAVGRGLTIAPADAQAAEPWKNRTQIVRIGKARCMNAIYLLGTGSALERDDADLLRRAVQAGR